MIEYQAENRSAVRGLSSFYKLMSHMTKMKYSLIWSCKPKSQLTLYAFVCCKYDPLIPRNSFSISKSTVIYQTLLNKSENRTEKMIVLKSLWLLHPPIKWCSKKIKGISIFIYSLKFCTVKRKSYLYECLNLFRHYAFRLPFLRSKLSVLRFLYLSSKYQKILAGLNI